MSNLKLTYNLMLLTFLIGENIVGTIVVSLSANDLKLSLDSHHLIDGSFIVNQVNSRAKTGDSWLVFTLLKIR